MTENINVEEIVRNVLAKVKKLEPANIALSAKLKDDLEIDSIDFPIDFAPEIEKSIGFQFPEDAYKTDKPISTMTVEDLIKFYTDAVTKYRK